MKKPKVAGAYAKALFQYLINHNRVEEISQQFSSFIEVWHNHKLLRDFFLSQAVSKEEKEQKLGSIFGGMFHPVFLIFLHLLVRRNHIGSLSYIYQNFEHLLDNYFSNQRVKIISPFPLADHYYQQFYSLIRQHCSGNIMINSEIDPSILGGFIISSDSFRIDCSIKHELEILRKKFYLISNGGEKPI